MKIDRMNVVVLSLISSLLLSGCHTSTSGSSPVKTDDPFVTNSKTTEQKTLTTDEVKKFIKEHDEEYGDIFSNLKENEIHIEEKEWKNQTLYFLLYTGNDSFATTLYQIREKDGEIEGLDYVSSGTTDYFSFDIISISEGNFITVYAATHMGNGNLEMIQLENIPGRKAGALPDYELYAIDNHLEGMEKETGTLVSKIFKDGILSPAYKDVNQDGNTDIVLSGVIQEYQSTKETEEELTNEKPVYEVYVFNPEDKTFMLQSEQDLREKKQLSISDMVINNHDLLNDTLCTEYKVQDIYQYQGKPKKIIDFKDESGTYRHYLIYDGIVYVVLNEKPSISDDPADRGEYLDYVILTNDVYSLSIGIQIGMSQEELTDTGIDFNIIKNGDDLDSELLSGKTGYLKKLKIDYDTIYYAEGTFEENIALAVMVKDKKVVRIATDKLY